MCISVYRNAFLYSLVAKATVQARQVQSSIAQTSSIALVPVALSLVPRQDEAVEVMQETVSREEDVLHSHAVQVV